MSNICFYYLKKFIQLQKTDKYKMTFLSCVEKNQNKYLHCKNNFLNYKKKLIQLQKLQKFTIITTLTKIKLTSKKKFVQLLIKQKVQTQKFNCHSL